MPGWGQYLKELAVSAHLVVEVPNEGPTAGGVKPVTAASPTLRTSVVTEVAAVATAQQVDPGIYHQLEVDVFDPDKETAYEVLLATVAKLSFLPEDQRLRAAFAANSALTPATVVEALNYHLARLDDSTREFGEEVARQEQEITTKEREIPALREQIARLTTQLQGLEGTVKADRQRGQGAQAGFTAAVDALRLKLTSERDRIAHMKGA